MLPTTESSDGDSQGRKPSHATRRRTRPKPAVSRPSDVSFELSNQIERKLLGTLLLSPTLLPLAVGIETQSFVGLQEAAIWQALIELYGDGIEIAFESVWERIVANGCGARFRAHGNEAYLVALTQLIDSLESLPDLLRVFRGDVSRRKLSLSTEEAATADSPKRTGKNQTNELMALFADHDGEVFRSQDDKPLVCLTDKGRRKTLPLAHAIRMLCLAYYRLTGLPVGARSKDEVQNLLSAMADDGPKRRTWIRVAEHEGSLYLDLGDDEWSVVRITPHGWEVVDSSPVHFMRPAAMCPLPMPVRGGRISELFELVNIPDRPSQALALAWIVAAFRPGRPLPLLAVHGKQGCAKSTTTKILTSLMDPKQTALRTRPKDEETVMVSAMNAWVLAYDNLSSIPAWMSDLLCCLSTGAAATARTKYTDADESVFQALRPVVLTSIVDIAERSDLIDRAVMLNLPTIAEEARRPEEEVWADFQAAHPRLLGALLDAVSSAMRKLPEVKPKVLPRMADFAKWAIAAEDALGLAEGEFMAAYSENRFDSHAQALDSCPIVEPLDRFMSQQAEWTGTASDLIDELETKATKSQRDHRRWPKDATRLSRELQRIAPNLKIAGFEVHQFRESNRQRRRLIQIVKGTEVGHGQCLQPRHQEQIQLVD